MRSPKHDANYRLQLAIEDRFAVVKLHQPDALFPSQDIAEAFEAAFEDVAPSHTIICDARGFVDDQGGYQELTNDALDLIRGLKGDSYCIATSDDIESLRLPRDIKILEVAADSPALSYDDLDLVPFAKEHELEEEALDPYRSAFDDRLPTREEYEFACRMTGLDQVYSDYDVLIAHFKGTIPEMRANGAPGGMEILGRRTVHRFVQERSRNSLLVEFAIQYAHREAHVVPYHAHALNEVTDGNELWLGRPAVIARRIRSAFEAELASFERLLSRKDVDERELQEWLERNPQLFHELGYAKIYPQVVLERENDGALIPDFILEPCDQRWCDILDIKRPHGKLIVGPKDRKHFSASVMELQAQLREYAAYFDNPKHTEAVEKKYGIKCFKPRLIGVIGREIPEPDSAETRRLMTSYKDAEVLTFDALVKRSRTRLLI